VSQVALIHTCDSGDVCPCTDSADCECVWNEHGRCAKCGTQEFLIHPETGKRYTPSKAMLDARRAPPRDMPLDGFVYHDEKVTE
jgi:hypothetical protein